MTPIDAFERHLPSALTDLAAPATPDYLTDILGRTAATQQRLAWASIERWLPVQLTTQRAGLEAELKAMNPLWDAAPPVGYPMREAGLPLEKLEQVYRRWSYVARWIGQLQERVVQLSL